MCPPELPDPDKLLTVVDQRPEEEILASYSTGAQQIADQTPPPAEPEEPAVEEKPKKKGGMVKKLILGCGVLGCLGIVLVVLVGGVGGGYWWYAMSDSPPDLSFLGDLEDLIPSGDSSSLDPPDGDWMTDGGGATSPDGGTGDEGTGDEGTGDGGTGDEGTGDGGTADEGTGDAATDEGAGDEGATEAPTPAEETTPADDGQADTGGRQDVNCGRGCGDTAGRDTTPELGPVSLDHAAQGMAIVGDSLSLSASTPGHRNCKVLVVYRPTGGSWSQQSMSRSGETHSTSLAVTAEMSPSFEYYLTVQRCGEGRSPAGGSNTVKVF